MGKQDMVSLILIIDNGPERLAFQDLGSLQESFNQYLSVKLFFAFFFFFFFIKRDPDLNMLRYINI